MTSDANVDALVEEEVKRLRIELDDYLGTVQALYAFADSARWAEEERRLRPGSYRSIPRTMTTQVGKEPLTLTPDCVVQVTDTHGVIAEAKKHYRSAEDISAFEQIAKYDQPLLGWWTPKETIEEHDLVLLTHYMSATRAYDAQKKWTSAGNAFERSFAIVEFNSSKQASTYFTLKKAAGSLSDPAHDEALHRRGSAEAISRAVLRSTSQSSSAAPSEEQLGANCAGQVG